MSSGESSIGQRYVREFAMSEGFHEVGHRLLTMSLKLVENSTYEVFRLPHGLLLIILVTMVTVVSTCCARHRTKEDNVT